MVEAPYRTPDGFADYPFIYVFDGSGLTDGTSPQRLAVPMQGGAEESFLLRRIVGLPQVAQQMLLYNESQSASFSALERLPQNYTVVPEKKYQAPSVIPFDLGTVARASIACGAQPIFLSFIGFQGVRRKPKPRGVSPLDSNYVYYERPWTYQFTLTLNWRRYVSLPGPVEPPRRFSILIPNYDFELNWISVRRSPSGALPATDDFLFQLYDRGQFRTSTAPIPLRWFNFSGSADFGSVWPAPGILYPLGSQIEFDIVSMICNTDGDFPRVYDMVFGGVERVPCR
jgi:hypothetical protein